MLVLLKLDIKHPFSICCTLLSQHRGGQWKARGEGECQKPFCWSIWVIMTLAWVFVPCINDAIVLRIQLFITMRDNSSIEICKSSP